LQVTFADFVLLIVSLGFVLRAQARKNGSASATQSRLKAEGEYAPPKAYVNVLAAQIATIIMPVNTPLPLQRERKRR
jgi:hypothetical protein